MRLKFYLVYFIPISLLIDWLVNFEILNSYFTSLIRVTHLSIAIGVLAWRGKLIRTSILSEAILLGVIFIFYSIISQKIEWNLYQSIRVLYWVLVGLVISDETYRDSNFKVVLISCIRITIFFASMFTILLMLQSERHQNGSAYYLLWLCGTLLYLTKWNHRDYFLAFFAAVAVFMTIKRGAILSMILMSAGGLYVLWRSINMANRIRLLLFGLVTLGFLVFFVSITGSWEHLLERSEDVGGSGRDILYSALISHYLNGSFFNILFGFGVNSVQDYTLFYFHSDGEIGVQAHSDWLQLTHDFGLIGILVMMAFIRRFWIAFTGSKTRDVHLRVSSLMLLLLFVTSTIYSFILTGPAALVLSIYLGQIKNLENG